jgi:hypothetical protein
LAAITRARSRLSRLGKDPALAQGVVEHRAAHVAPLLDVLGGHHLDVGGQTQRREHALQAHDLAEAVGDVRLDDQQVDVAVRASVATRVRPEEDDARTRRGRDDAPRGLVDEPGGYQR